MSTKHSLEEIKVPLSAEDRKFYENYIGGNVGAPVVLTLDDALVAALARIEHLESYLKDLKEPLSSRHDYTAEDIDESVVELSTEALNGSPEEALHRLKARHFEEAADLLHRKFGNGLPDGIAEELLEEAERLKNVLPRTPSEVGTREA